MTNPFDQNDPNRPSDSGDQPNYDAYQYPSGGDAAQPGYGTGYGAGYGADNGGGYGAGYGAGPGGSTWAMEEEKNRVAPWALGVGIVALLAAISILATGLAFIVGIIGLVIAIVAIVRARRVPGAGRRMGMSVTGLILSVIAIALSVVFWVVVGIFFSETGMSDCLEITDMEQQQTCIENSVNDWVNS